MEEFISTYLSSILHNIILSYFLEFINLSLVSILLWKYIFGVAIIAAIACTATEMFQAVQSFYMESYTPIEHIDIDIVTLSIDISKQLLNWKGLNRQGLMKTLHI
jgi:hypothetical protein